MTARRQFIAGALALACVPSAAQATPEAVADAVRELLAGRQVRDGALTIDVPPLVENGNAVPLTVAAAAGLSVVALHVFTEKNPQPHVLHARFTAATPAARVATRVKLADSQTVLALAELADGTFLRARADVIVTLAACIEDPT